MTSSTPGIFDLATPGPNAGSTTLIPPRRLGRLLSAARADAGLTLEEVAALSGGRFNLSALSSIERGTWELSDEDAGHLAAMYRVESTALVPPRSRLIVDLDEGFLQVDEHRTSIQRSAPSKDEVLARYLTMVYSMRRVDPGRTVTLRVEDLDVLGRALRVGTRTLEADLEALMSHPTAVVRWHERILQRRVLIPAAGVLVAALGVGALVLMQGPDPVGAQTMTEQNDDRSSSLLAPSLAATNGPASSIVSSAPVPVDIGTAIVQERNADGSPGDTRVRLGDELDPVASVDVGDAVTQEAGEVVVDGGATLIEAETLER
ncbi:MAG: helix-turn-helix transcriptional regulator [Actinobacteria bacterium]|nr:helix-turn-helix transcriptional regulator [Actinomycetota bacterium]